MANKNDVLAVAKRYADDGDWSYRHFCSSFGCGLTHWCAIFISVISREGNCASIFPYSASCNAQIAWWKDHGCWLGITNDVRPGDIIYYDWDHQDYPPADHVGIVESVNGNTIVVIEGNTDGNANGDPDTTRVARRTIQKGYYCTFGFARPQYDGEESGITPSVSETPTLRYGSKGDAVAKAQRLLAEKGYDIGYSGADGDFGDDTLAAVKKFQADTNLEVDGIIGELTWAELVKVVEKPMIGDLNGDHVIDEADVQILSRFLIGDGEYNEAMDLTNDGNVNAADLAALQQIAANGFKLKTITKGYEGWEVKLIQNILISKGLDFSEEGADGIFTEETAYNINYFCKGDLDGEYGRVGAKTWDYILSRS